MKKILSVFFLIMFVIGTDTFLISPLLPTLRDQFGVGRAQSGWMVSIYALGYALYALIGGPLSDRWNRKLVLIGGMSGFAFATFLCGFAESFWQMLCLRGLAGIFAAVASPQVWALIPIVAPPSKILKATGVVAAGLAVSQTLGVPLGSYLARQSWSIPFFILGAFTLVLILPALFIIPNTHTKQADARTAIIARYRELLGTRKAQYAFLAYFVFQAGNFAAFTFLGTWLADQFVMTIDQIGTVLLFLGLGNIVGSFYGNLVVVKMGRKNALLTGFGLMALIYLLMGRSPSVVFVQVALFLIFFIAGTLFPLMMAQLQMLSDTARGTIASLSNATMYGATTFGVYIAGLLYVHAGGFQSICIFASFTYILSGFLWMKSGSLRGIHDK
ncbi:MFS transporter [Sporolactobacillus shoreicorticis]|uniref:MFS transporter n=1 Tax=Sporolactobacillus shoreicorticis TaxID=1923877 RepID=A0ABW5SAH0_9BACL|nr:MFS transporter [Sporolactobacillus shoreicorticis]MCO7125537.1 MFS transporter [Sporolactobacillus shoreicorticis]